MHSHLRANLLLLLLAALFTFPVHPSVHVSAVAAADCDPTGHLISRPTLNRDPAWLNSTLRGVAATDPASVWVVGDYTLNDPQQSQGRALIEHWNGTSWQRVSHPADGPIPNQTSALSSIAVIDGRDIFAVGVIFTGADAASQPLIEHWNGSAWTIWPSAPPTKIGLSLVAASSPSDLWVAGGAGRAAPLFHWDGRAWQTVSVSLLPGIDPYWTSLIARAPNDAWATASLYDTNRGRTGGALLLHWDGQSWTPQAEDLMTTYATLLAVAAAGPQDVWAAGRVDAPIGPVPTSVPTLVPGNGTPSANPTPEGAGPLFLHWDGSLWTRVPAPKGYLIQALSFPRTDDGWAMGLDYRVSANSFGLLHWNGTSWTPRAVGGSDEPFAYPDSVGGIAVEGADDLWAVGYGHTSEPRQQNESKIAHIFRDCAVPTAPSPDPQDPAVTYFPATGHTLRGLFRAYWQAHGGLAQFGYPLSDAFGEINPEDGRVYTVQYFERNRFELHPEHAGTAYEVLLGLLGRTLTSPLRLGQQAAFQGLRQGPAGAMFFPATGHSLAEPFRRYWEDHGGLPVYGYPISEPFTEISATDGQSYLVQYFERNRLEFHPELPSEYRISLGLLGADLLRSRGWLP